MDPLEEVKVVPLLGMEPKFLNHVAHSLDSNVSLLSDEITCMTLSATFWFFRIVQG
jgi:hypothetical protein